MFAANQASLKKFSAIENTITQPSPRPSTRPSSPAECSAHCGGPTRTEEAVSPYPSETTEQCSRGASIGTSEPRFQNAEALHADFDSYLKNYDVHGWIASGLEMLWNLPIKPTNPVETIQCLRNFFTRENRCSMTDLEVELLNDEIVALKREEQQLLFLKAELEEKVHRTLSPVAQSLQPPQPSYPRNMSSPHSGSGPTPYNGGSKDKKGRD